MGGAPSNVYPGGEFSYWNIISNQWTTRNDVRDLAFQTYVTPDTTAPKVASTDPAAGARGVARGANLRATFSEKMDHASINRSTFKLFKCPSAASTNCTTQVTNAAVAPSEDGLGATLDPYGASSTRLGVKAKYKAVVTTGAKDVAGNALDQDPAISGNQQTACTSPRAVRRDLTKLALGYSRERAGSVTPGPFSVALIYPIARKAPSKRARESARAPS